MKTKVAFLSLGPGDPELLTLKAARILREADMVVLPATKSGTAHQHSRAADIIRQWCGADKIRIYELPMQKNRSNVMAVYDRICQDVMSSQQAGLRVVVAVEGDVSIYASIHYVLERLQAEGIPVEQQAGIPSFIAAAASAGLSLVSQEQRLVVLPGSADADTLSQLLATSHVVVIMKLSQCQQELKDFLLQHPDVSCHYFENVGTAAEYHTTSHADILQRPIPYFSLCILGC